jgi:hypothetical protein
MPSVRPSAALGACIVRAAVASGRLHTRVASWLEAERVALEGFLWEALSVEEKASIALRLYDRARPDGGAGLHPWEAAWLERELPPAPARVLVGGAGSGRELSALLARGYRVAGFEPAARLAAAAQRSLPSAVPLWTVGYEHLAQRGLGAEPARGAPYDAILFGWGSFSHVLDPELRRRALRAAAQLCPEGPLLLSFHMQSEAWQPRHRSARTSRFPRRLGRVLGRFRGLDIPPADADVFLPHAGFVHRFTHTEVEALAAAVGRAVRWGEDLGVYPHCVLPAH